MLKREKKALLEKSDFLSDRDFYMFQQLFVCLHGETCKRAREKKKSLKGKNMEKALSQLWCFGGGGDVGGGGVGGGDVGGGVLGGGVLGGGVLVVEFWWWSSGGGVLVVEMLMVEISTTTIISTTIISTTTISTTTTTTTTTTFVIGPTI